jgi:Leucine-rich repeat (LRR) protein
LPSTLLELDCNYNQLIELKNLSNKLKNLNCSNNQLKELENLPNKLTYLNCNNNQLTELKNLPNALQYLNCNHNQLIELKNLPNTLYTLFCEHNQLLFTELSKILKLNKFIKFYCKYKLFKFIFYNLIRKRCSKYKEDLIAKALHPSRIFKYFNNSDDIDTFMENI